MKVDWEKEKDKLKSLIDSNISYSEIGKIYKVSGAAVKKAAKKLNIPLPSRRKKNPSETFNRGKTLKLKTKCYCLNCNKELSGAGKFCSNHCQMEYQNKQKTERWLKGENFRNGITQVPRFIKRYLMNLHNNCCERCGWGKMNEYSNTIPLEVHHKDGNCTNNLIENLELLCPNCHSLTENFGTLNKESKRFFRKKIRKNMVVVV